MEKYVLGAAILIPVMLFGGTSGAGPHCNYTQPALVYKQACLDDACRKAVREYLPACKEKLSGRFTKRVNHAGGTETAPYLSLAVMNELTDCIAGSGFSQFDRNSVDLSQFSEVSSDVRSSKAKRVGGDCNGKNCSGVFIYPVVGKTTFLYGPA